MKMRDALLELYQSEDQWVQQISAMVDKNNEEELDAWLNPNFSIEYRVNGRSFYSLGISKDDLPSKVLQTYLLSADCHPVIDPCNVEVTCWCLSGAINRIQRWKGIEPYTFVREFEKKYGVIDKFNDTHTFEEVIEAIKSIDA